MHKSGSLLESDRFKDIEEIAKGEFGTIFEAKWIYGDGILKINDSNSLETISKVVSILNFGISQDPETNEYDIVLQFMPDGNLRLYRL
ncbi:hypothetical protein Glove_71g37 [Diversispora epigaea]|uniref:Protein kinase domain-containing protein n=1 Tax=Diversispora epigaea TaxID=1348612 RepID=A0A397JKU3_9GLOM|nr:hypothetical protein Glove_71g37 [Diversispora epigaea]